MTKEVKVLTKTEGETKTKEVLLSYKKVFSKSEYKSWIKRKEFSFCSFLDGKIQIYCESGVVADHLNAAIKPSIEGIVGYEFLQAKEGMRPRYSDANIPLRYQGEFEFVKVNESAVRNLEIIKSYAKKFDDLLDDGTSLILCGKKGTAKTRMACELLKDLSKQGYEVHYCCVQDFFDNVQNSYENKDISTASIVKELTDCDLLVIDEIGKQKGSEFEQRQLFKVLNKRYNDVLPTVLISNLNIDAISNYIGEYAVDRLRENGGKLLTFEWDSYRITNNIKRSG